MIRKKMTMFFILLLIILFLVYTLIFRSYLYFEKYLMIYSDSTMVPALSDHTGDAIIKFITNYFENFGGWLASMLVNWSTLKVIAFAFSTGILFFVSYMLAGILCKKISTISYSIKKLEKGNYSESRTGKGFLSGIESAVNSLSGKLLMEEKNRLALDNTKRTNILQASDELEKCLAGIRGNADVLHDAGIVPEAGYESKLLSVIIEKALLAETELEYLRQALENRS